jgi:hypothetical protein
VPDASWVRICCWYWSAELVLSRTLTPGFAALNAFTTSSIEPWSTEEMVNVPVAAGALVAGPAADELVAEPLVDEAPAVEVAADEVVPVAPPVPAPVLLPPPQAANTDMARIAAVAADALCLVMDLSWSRVSVGLPRAGSAQGQVR